MSRLRAFDPDGLIRRLPDLASPIFWILLLCFLFIFPAITLRGAHYEEGTLISIARGVFEDGHWLTPYRYGERFVERPALLAWVLGLVGFLTGSVPDWLARIPIAMALIGGCGLVYCQVRKYASAGAGLFGVLCLMASPLMQQKLVTAELDFLLGTLEFAAFVVIWDAEIRGGAGFVRWTCAGLILAAAALTKGPQQLAFFFLGLGAFYLLRSRWFDICKLALAGLIPAAATIGWYWSVYETPEDLQLWLIHSRLPPPGVNSWLTGVVQMGFHSVLQFLPGILLLPLAVRAFRQQQSARVDTIMALALYTGIGMVILVFWPGARVRYSAPALFAIACIGGITFEQLRSELPQLVKAAAAIALALAVFRVAVNWIAMPMAPEPFAQTRFYGKAIAETMAVHPATLYFTENGWDHNIFVYVPYRLRQSPIEDIVRADAPFWAMVGPDEEQKLRKARPQMKIVVHLESPQGRWRLLEVTDDRAR